MAKKEATRTLVELTSGTVHYTNERGEKTTAAAGAVISVDEDTRDAIVSNRIGRPFDANRIQTNAFGADGDPLLRARNAELEEENRRLREQVERLTNENVTLATAIAGTDDGGDVVGSKGGGGKSLGDIVSGT